MCAPSIFVSLCFSLIIVVNFEDPMIKILYILLVCLRIYIIRILFSLVIAGTSFSRQILVRLQFFPRMISLGTRFEICARHIFNKNNDLTNRVKVNCFNLYKIYNFKFIAICLLPSLVFRLWWRQANFRPKSRCFTFTQSETDKYYKVLGTSNSCTPIPHMYENSCITIC